MTIFISMVYVGGFNEYRRRGRSYIDATFWPVNFGSLLAARTFDRVVVVKP